MFKPSKYLSQISYKFFRTRSHRYINENDRSQMKNELQLPQSPTSLEIKTQQGK